MPAEQEDLEYDLSTYRAQSILLIISKLKLTLVRAKIYSFRLSTHFSVSEVKPD